jgi:hypothetical protein
LAFADRTSTVDIDRGRRPWTSTVSVHPWQVVTINISGCSRITDEGAATMLKHLSGNDSIRNFTFSGALS